MKEYTKYEKFLFKAEAVKNIAANIDYRIKDAKTDQEYYENCINERIKERTAEDPEFNPDDDWSIRSYYDSIAKDHAEIALWQKCLKLLDKEMGE